MSPRAVRRIVLVVFVAGIGGMILGSILDNNGVAITFGLTTAVAALGLILVTMVVPADAFQRRQVASDAAESASAPSRDHDGTGVDESGAMVEEQVDQLVGAGADEREVRELVRRVMAFARQSG